MMTGNWHRLQRFTADMAEGKMSEISQQTGTAGTEPKKHYSDQELSTVQERIARGGRILRLGCRIARIVLIIMIVINLGLLITVFFNADAVKMAKEAFEDNALIQTISPLLISSGIEPVYVAAISSFVVLISTGTLLFFVHMAYQMFHHLAEGERPFNLESARKMRKYCWFLLLLMLYNVPLGIVSCGILLLFSYIMEYGCYIQQRADETNRIQEEIIVSFAEITENKSGQTGQHIKRVSEYTRILAEQMGYSPKEVEYMRIASTMHDIGKLMIPSEILEKPGRLTDDEYAVIKTHTTYGGELLKNVEGEEMNLSRTIALQHHERVDGKGYPAQLSGEDISMEGKIVAVADVYDALTSKRSYKEAWKEEDAAAEIVKGSGTQFDARVVDAFRQAHDKILEVQQKYHD